MSNMAELVGTQLDNYRIVEKIGEGGMGAVYRAVDVMLERDVALKFLRPELAREPELVQRFRSEAVMLARLNHHFIAPIYGLHRYGDDLFIAMEYVPGETLDARLKRLSRLPPGTALHVTSMVLQALDYAHRLGVVHRDIKPGNIIVAPAGTLKVMDFGIARVLGSERRTRVGSIVGTLAYMAPEQIQGLDTDQRADLYSVGIMLYEMLVGHVPFKADTDWALMQAQIGQQPQMPREDIDLPEVLESAVLRALEKSPERRFQNAFEFHSALEAAARQLEGRGTSAPMTSLAPGGETHPPQPTGVSGVASWEETRVSVPTPLPVSPSGLMGRGLTPPGSVPLSGAGVPAPPPPSGVQLSPPAATPAAAPVALPSTPPPVAAVAPAAGRAAAPKAPHAAASSKGRTLWLVVGVAVLALVAGAAAWFAWLRPSGIAAEQVDPIAEVLGAPPTGVDRVLIGDGGAALADGAVPDVPPVPSAPATGATPGARPAPRRDASASAPRGSVRSDADTPVAPDLATPPEAAGPAPVEDAPPPAEASAASAASAPLEVFKNVKMVRQSGPELDVELHFEPGQLSIRNVGGRHALHTLGYGSIAAAEYYESRHTRVFVRTTRHWLTLKTAGGAGVLLRLEREDQQKVIDEVERRLGRPVQVTDTKEEK
jgi:serine/threonine-protein kinase